MAKSRESDSNYQPLNQYGIRKPLSVDEPTAEYHIIQPGFLDSHRLPRNSVIPMKNKLDAAIRKYRKMYGQNGENNPG